MGITELITAGLQAVTSVGNEVQQHEKLKNDPALQKALFVHRMQEFLDDQRKDVADENLDEVRKLVSDPDAGLGGA